PPAHGTAVRAGRGIRRRERRGRAELVAGARRDAARGARRQHDRRTRGRRIEMAGDGGRSSSGAGVMGAAGTGAGRVGPSARRSVPQGVQPVLRSVSPSRAAGAAARRLAPGYDDAVDSTTEVTEVTENRYLSL